MTTFNPFKRIIQIPLFMVFVLLSGCASSAITSVPKIKTEKPFSSVFVIGIDTKNEVRSLTRESYENYVAGEYNSIDGLKMRNQLEKAIARNISLENFPRVVKSNEIFKTDESYSYTEFMSKIKATGVEAILLVNMREYWYSEKYVTTHYENSSVTREESEPNSSYYAYLYDIENPDEYLWIGKVIVNGIYAGYDTLNNYSARTISKKLRKEKYIY